MPGYVYPTVAEAIQIHTQLIEGFGGLHGLRDPGRLEAAIFRPQLGYYNSLLEEAAALMEGLGNNNAFLDGNKRLSFALPDVFLRLNGFYLEVAPVAAHEFITKAMTGGKFRFSTIREWLQAHLARLPKG